MTFGKYRLCNSNSIIPWASFSDIMSSASVTGLPLSLKVQSFRSLRLFSHNKIQVGNQPLIIRCRLNCQLGLLN